MSDRGKKKGQGSPTTSRRPAEVFGRLSPEQLQEENQRLRVRIRELEEGWERDRQSLAALKTECAGYRQAVVRWAQNHFTEEDKRRFAEGENLQNCQTLDQFIGELEELVQGKNHG